MRHPKSMIDNFCRRHPDFGVTNLMKYITIANAAFWVLGAVNPVLLSYLAFNPALILRGQVWRIVSFIFYPPNTSLIAFVAFYFYYWIGSTLEQYWGTAQFNCYFFSGVILTVLYGFIIYFVFGINIMLNSQYIYLSMFFSFAALFPDMQVLFMFIIPVKVKWLAIVDAVFFALGVLSSLLRLDILGALVPVVALLNFFVFFWTDITDEISYRRGRAKHQTSHQTIQFKSAVRQQKKKEAERGYRHKCEVCGRTDTDYPDLEFRYCSRCAGYHCFCQDHIFNHEHFTQ